MTTISSDTEITCIFRVPAGGSANLTVTATSATATSAIVIDIEVYTPSGAQAYQVWFDNQSFAAGQQRVYSATWQVPSTAALGSYVVDVGVFSGGWVTLYKWTTGVDTFAVTAPGATATPVPNPTATVVPTIAPTVTPTVLPTFTVAPSPVPGAFTLIPSNRLTTWSPGIPGGIPARTTVCANVSAGTYGNGSADARAGIQAAIDACPVGQVVQLSAGDFKISGRLEIAKSIVLRGMGPTQTKLKMPFGTQDNVITVPTLAETLLT